MLLSRERAQRIASYETKSRFTFRPRGGGGLTVTAVMVRATRNIATAVNLLSDHCNRVRQCTYLGISTRWVCFIYLYNYSRFR